MEIRCNWTKEEVRAIHDSPLLDLVFRAGVIHRQYHAADEVQTCALYSIKTGGCAEDCKYCPQAARYHTDVKSTAMMQEEEILELAKRAIANGTTRVCLGVAWRSVREGVLFDRILSVVEKITAMGVEVCCCLGMLNEIQAERLKKAGLFAYNHNLDTSANFYSTIISTRTYEDRLKTLDAVEKAGIGVCCGGIIGMGESVEDRVGLLHTLASRSPHPESVPINLLVPVPGTPLEDQQPVPIWEFVRMVATARILMPKAMVRLSAGRIGRSMEEQALCFLAGANSIFYGEKLLTRPNPNFDADKQMLRLFGLKVRPAFGGA